MKILSHNLWYFIKIFLLFLSFIKLSDAINEYSSMYNKSTQLILSHTSVINGKRYNFHGKEIEEYLGVPYAQPPVGDLRFRRAQPINNYWKSYDAYEKPRPCPGPNNNNTRYPWTSQRPQKEDCLYLNIWKPVKRNHTQKLPIMVMTANTIDAKIFNGK